MSIVDRVQFDADGLIPAVITDTDSKRVLVLCYLNREALERTIAEGVVYVYRRSKGQVMQKGVSSGHIQKITEVRANCDANSLEIRVEQEVAACHAGFYSCYYRTWDEKNQAWSDAEERIFDPDKVYT
jgi:phosphoribosyl-AMP cyclohydrolase